MPSPPDPFNPGSGPYNYPQITITSPLLPPPQQLTNVGTLIDSQSNTVGTMIFRNGLLLSEGSGADYTRDRGRVYLTDPPVKGDVLVARVFARGLQLGGATPERYIAPWKLRLDGPFDGEGTNYRIVFGPTIFGLTDGKNPLFTWSVSLARAQIYRNGLLQTDGVDVSNGPLAMVFMKGSIPQDGDILTVLGYPG